MSAENWAPRRKSLAGPGKGVRFLLQADDGLIFYTTVLMMASVYFLPMERDFGNIKYFFK